MLFRIAEGNILAVGDSSGSVAIWDVTKSKQLRTMSGHSDRVPVLHWNAHILASGCRDGQVHSNSGESGSRLEVRCQGNFQTSS